MIQLHATAIPLSRPLASAKWRCVARFDNGDEHATATVNSVKEALAFVQSYQRVWKVCYFYWHCHYLTCQRAETEVNATTEEEAIELCKASVNSNKQTHWSCVSRQPYPSGVTRLE